MKQILFILVLTLMLAVTGCANPMYRQQYVVQEPPTLTQMQAQCFSKEKLFDAQTKCIANAINATGIAPDAGIQEYLLLMASLQEKVAQQKLSANDARLKLAGKLKELKIQQQNELVLQQQLENQRSAQIAEVLRQSAPKPLAYTDIFPTRPPTTHTDCIANGSHLNCTSKQW